MKIYFIQKRSVKITFIGETVEVSLETKISQVLEQIKSRKAVIVFDQGSETYTVLKSDNPVLEGIGN